MADITSVKIVPADSTNLNQQTQITVLTQSSGTINLANLSFSNSTPIEIGRTGSAGSSNLAARADHAHSGANLLLDGGNY